MPPSMNTEQADEEKRRNAPVHAVMVPCPLPSHVNTMLEFAKALVACYGFRITLVTNEHIYSRLQQRWPDELSGYANLHLEWVDDRLSPDFDHSNPSSSWEDFSKGCENMKAPLQALMESFNRQESSPSVSYVIYGSFFPWAHQVARELGIPSIFFWTQSVAVFSIYYHRGLLVSNGFYPYKGSSAEELVSYIPGIPPLHPARLPGFLQVEDPSHVAFNVIDHQFTTMKECKSVIFNSFHELDKEAFEALPRDDLNVFLVGPLLPASSGYRYGGDVGVLIKDANVEESLSRPTWVINEESNGYLGRGDPNLVAKDKGSECIRWLDTQKKHSVVYISFGTIYSPSKEDVASIALGLRALEQPFLWVIRLVSSDHNLVEVLPENFLEETKEYGIIVSWAPQIEVLAHASVGTFLTHCGWNSVLESVSMGVPMITCPGTTDQPTNCMYVVEVWKVGMELKRSTNGNVDGDEFEKVLGCLMQEEDGHAMRHRACKLRDAAKRALICGSSLLDFHRVAQLLRSSMVGIL